MTSPDWTTISTIASTLAIAMGGFLWIVTKVFNLGKTSQRLDSIESDLAAFKKETRAQFGEVKADIAGVRTDLNQRMDKLILTIAESNRRS